VLAGVSAGEQVITEAPATLKDGDAVRVAEASSPRACHDAWRARTTDKHVNRSRQQ
jgi:hypothetical protein